MRGVKDFLIKVDSNFETKVKLRTTGQTLLLSSVYGDAFDLKSTGEVIATPSDGEDLGISVGDVIATSYLVFMDDMNVMERKKLDSPYLVDPVKKIYRVPKELVYAYIRNGELKLPSPFIFVKPIEYGKAFTKHGIIIPNSGKIQQFGVISVGNDDLKKQGMEEGDVVVFLKYSEYEINVSGEKYYRMQNDWLMAKYEAELEV